MPINPDYVEKVTEERLAPVRIALVRELLRMVAPWRFAEERLAPWSVVLMKLFATPLAMIAASWGDGES